MDFWTTTMTSLLLMSDEMHGSAETVLDQRRVQQFPMDEDLAKLKM